MAPSTAIRPPVQQALRLLSLPSAALQQVNTTMVNVNSSQARNVACTTVASTVAASTTKQVCPATKQEKINSPDLVIKKEDKTNKKKKKSSRAGVPNYSADDVAALLDIVEATLPIGSNQWSIVETKFAEWVTENERPGREIDSFRIKFDKLAAAKKPTGNPSCPESVRRAKSIAKQILAKCTAKSIDDTSDSSDADNVNKEDDDNVKTAKEAEGKAEVLGERKNKRRSGASGVSSASTAKQFDSQFLNGFKELTGHVEGIRQELSQPIGAGISKDDVPQIVRDEVAAVVQSSIEKSSQNLAETVVAMLSARLPNGTS